ncbi:MAG: heme-copper oxidase subunit III [Chloroflexi bacterium]|nr:heme-copper oxidase subunit III [Chloroflexota bacterium]
MIFISVIAMYLTGQGHQGHPSAPEMLDAGRMVPFSIALWLSSLTIWLAGRRGARLWLTATIVLGAIFLAGELSEWLDLFGKQVTAASNVWSTTFFTLTGLHGMHVVLGLLAMLAMFGYGMRRRLTHDGESAFELVSIYWHFVDGMWVLIYGIVYFWSAFLGG